MIKRNERYSGDHGLDGKLLTRGGMIFIQSKRYSGYINPKDVSDFGEVCKRHNAYGLFIHTGKTGKKSRGSKSRHVDIISGDRLLNLISASKISLRLPFSYRLKSIWNFLFTTPVNY
jgi:restriction system protein